MYHLDLVLLNPSDSGAICQCIYEKIYMYDLYEKRVNCPYCGEPIDVLLDPSVPHQNYIEDCQVCCRPIIFDVTVSGESELTVFVSSEGE